VTSVFGGRYRQIRLLGRGGMGEVWQALDVDLDRLVAVKVMTSRMLAGEAGAERFRQEMRLAARMQHPNVVTVFTSGTEKGIPFMVMEYLEGHDLTCVPPGWGSGEVARVGREACAALAYAHGLKVVHRDIKPGNLFVCESGLVKVTDFGIAKALTVSNAARPGTVIGTPAYMAPEQWLGRPATFAIDVSSGVARSRTYLSNPVSSSNSVRLAGIEGSFRWSHTPSYRRWLSRSRPSCRGVRWTTAQRTR
jgi:eukaryotic-like serine/threonine-protein kinase